MSVTRPILAIFLAICISFGHGKAPSKIYYSEDAPSHSFNFIASLRVEGKHICGGTLIDNYHVLTAASCLVHEKNIVQNNVKVLVGTHNQDDPSTGFIHDVAIIIIHEEFDCLHSWINDISILRLSQPVSEISGLPMIAHLPLTGDIPINNKALAAGWGTEDTQPNKLQTTLKRSSVTVISNMECELEHLRAISTGHLCVESLSGLTFSKGDGGGPLVSEERDFVVYGIISWSSDHLPGVLTRVYHYLDWIETVRARY